MRIGIYSLLAGAALLLASCASAPVGPAIDPAEREAQARSALASGDYAAARELYAGLVERTAGEQRADAQIGLARAEVGLGRPEPALAVIEAMPAILPDELDAARAAVRAAAYFALGRTVDAVELLVEREIWLQSSAEVLENQSAIWDGLTHPSSAASAGTRTGDPIIDGWLALAPLTQLSGDHPELVSRLLEWREAFPNHPAAAGVLAERLAGSRPAGMRPARIALLLPLSSDRRAEALSIQAGFFAAHFDSAFVDESEIHIYDTAQRGSVESFLTAQIEGAEFVVGPLLPAEVERVQAQAGFIPTLALNLGRPQTAGTTNFFQFALSSDDEIEAIATRAIADGHRTAVVLHAATERGIRQRDRFTEAFEARGGTVLNNMGYERALSNLSAPIEELLNISESRARYQRLVSGLGRAVEFEPRLRADIDMIFLQADPAVGPADARLLAPLLRDNGADPGQLPTYATSDIYDPTRAGGDPDLNGLIFPDVPLLVDPDGGGARSAAESLRRLTTSTAEQRKRLFAFGYDAYRLVTALYAGSDAGWPIAGATGELYQGDNGRIRRILPFAAFRGGVPESLAPGSELLGAR